MHYVIYSIFCGPEVCRIYRTKFYGPVMIKIYKKNDVITEMMDKI